MEIEDAQLTRLKSFEEMFDKIGKGKNRSKLLALVKEDFPDIPIPEVDAAKPLHDGLAAIQKQFDDFKAEVAKEREDRAEEDAKRSANRSIADSRRKLREAGWDDEGIEKIEAYMQEKNNPDYESAAELIRSRMPPPSDNMPTTFAGQSWNWFRPEDGDEDHKLLAKGPTGARQFQERVIGRWKQDMRRQQGRVA